MLTDETPNIMELCFRNGEQFWGGARTARDQNALMVQPMLIEPVNRGHWVIHSSGKGVYANNWAECSECHVCGSPNWKVCPVCEARMVE